MYVFLFIYVYKYKYIYIHMYMCIYIYMVYIGIMENNMENTIVYWGSIGMIGGLRVGFWGLHWGYIILPVPND